MSHGNASARAIGATTPGHGRAWVWPMMVVLLLAGSVISGVATAIIASRDPSIAIEENYYEKSMQWDKAARVRAASEATGWIIVASIDAVVSAPRQDRVAPTHDDPVRTLRLVLTTRDGTPLGGARVEAEVFHMARRADALTLTLLPEASDATSNAYVCAFPAPMAGRYRVRVSIDRGPEHFERTLDVEAEDAQTPRAGIVGASGGTAVGAAAKGRRATLTQRTDSDFQPEGAPC